MTFTRQLLAVAGVAVTTTSFVGLVARDNRAVNASPWWLIGLIGLLTVLLALGSPSAGHATDD